MRPYKSKRHEEKETAAHRAASMWSRSMFLIVLYPKDKDGLKFTMAQAPQEVTINISERIIAPVAVLRSGTKGNTALGNNLLL